MGGNDGDQAGAFVAITVMLSTFGTLNGTGAVTGTGALTKTGDAYLRNLLILGARSVMASLGDKQDRFSRWVRSLVERRGYWRAAVAVAAKNAISTWPATSSIAAGARKARYCPGATPGGGANAGVSRAFW